MTKNEIADILNEIATLLELKGENPFKVRAYQAGARALEALEENIDTVIKEGRLGTIKGLGDALIQKITELHASGSLKFHEELKASVPPGMVEMLDIPGLGPKKIVALREKLGVTDIAALTKACEEGQVATLAGFGEKTQSKLLQGIRNREAYGRRHLWFEAAEVAEPILSGLRSLPQVLRAEHAGSLRRGMETVGDLDFLVAASEVEPVVEWFVTREGVKEVTARGDTKASVRYGSGLQADLRIVPEEQFYFALHHFTGSKDHNVQMRQRALARGLSLSEWGLVPAEGEGTAKEKAEQRASLPAESEADVFTHLGLRFIPPELREGMGEIEWAETHEFPRLLDSLDLRGTFHAHTTASDGRSTLLEMVMAAESLGWEYVGITDHSKASFQARGLDEARLAQQVEDIRRLNASGRFKLHVFAGSEVDVLTDGSLDFGDDVLQTLDFVIASVHNATAMSEDDMTRRIVKAIENPHVTMLGHITGRLLLRREAYKVDVARVIDAALANETIIELNATPERLDMDWRHWRRAAERGLLCSLNPDAHDTEGLRRVESGVRVARKGWLTREHVFNTRPLVDIQRWFAKV
ncbi:MAG: DNA polymerase/3'-5' exonuclease PolX [Opitutaceae bacterium]|nr:DNA polymerase/3'-5' exonuclease PolX [Opitutaceae bacterium]